MYVYNKIDCYCALTFFVSIGFWTEQSSSWDWNEVIISQREEEEQTPAFYALFLFYVRGFFFLFCDVLLLVTKIVLYPISKLAHNHYIGPVVGWFFFGGVGVVWNFYSVTLTGSDVRSHVDVDFIWTQYVNKGI